MNVFPNCIIVLFLFASASLLNIGSSADVGDAVDPCTQLNANYSNETAPDWCLQCVGTKVNDSSSNETCEFFVTNTGLQCNKPEAVSQFSLNVSTNAAECEQRYPGNKTTTTTTAPPTTTTTTTTTTTVPPTNSTTTTTTTAAPTTTSTTTTTTLPPTKATTTEIPSSTPAPSGGGGGGFSFATFLGGIVFTLAVASLAYIVWRFYKARTEQNYHTL